MGVDRLEVINSSMLEALRRAAGKRTKVLSMNAYEPAAAYHSSVKLLYQKSNHRLNYNIITHRNASLRSLIWSHPETIISKKKKALFFQ